MLRMWSLSLIICLSLVVGAAAFKKNYATRRSSLRSIPDCNCFSSCQTSGGTSQIKSEQTNEPAESLALFYAAGVGDYARVQSLIKSGFDVNWRDKDGMTPLFPAARNGRTTPAVIALLVSSGADVNARNKVGETPLLYAIDPGGDIENIKALLDEGADPNIHNAEGVTPLMRASDWGSVHVLRILLQKGAFPDLKRKDGRTALMIAAADGEYESVVLLIAHKANPNLRDNSGNTALSLAIANFRTRGRINRYTRAPSLHTIEILRRLSHPTRRLRKVN